MGRQQKLTSVIEMSKTHLGWVDANENRGTILFFTLNSFNMNNVFGPVNGDNFAHTGSLVVAANNLKINKTHENKISPKLSEFTHLNLIVFANGNRSDTVFLTQILAQRGTHDASSNVGWSVEMTLACLPSRGGYQLVHFCHFELVVCRNSALES